MPDPVTLTTDLSAIDNTKRAELLAQLQGATGYQARLQVIRTFAGNNPSLAAYATADDAQLRMIALNLLMQNSGGQRSYAGMQNYFRAFVGAGADDTDNATQINTLLATELRAVQNLHNDGGDMVAATNPNWVDGPPPSATFFTTTLGPGSQPAIELLNSAGINDTAFPITSRFSSVTVTSAPVVNPLPTPADPPPTVVPVDNTAVLSAQQTAHLAGVPAAAINNPRHTYWYSGANSELYAQLFPHVSVMPDVADDTYVDALVPTFVAPDVTPVTIPAPVVVAPPVVLTPPTLTVVRTPTVTRGNVPMSPPVPLDNIQVTAIGSVNLRALPAAFQYTGTEAEINSAMFTDMDNAYDLLINVAGRPRAASPGETPTVTGLSRADFTQLYRTISQIDPRQPALDIQSALSTNLMAMGFTEAEIRDLANNPARLQMLARVSYAASDNTQFGAIAALDGPTTPTPTTVSAADLTALRDETRLLARGFTNDGTGTSSGLPTLDPQAPSIARNSHAFRRAQIISSALIYNPGNRQAVVGQVTTASFANWEAYRAPVSNITNLLVAAMDPTRTDGHLASFGESQALALQTLMAPGDLDPARITELCRRLHLNEADIIAMRNDPNNRAAAHATATWMVSSLQNQELQRLHSPFDGTNPTYATRDDMIVLNTMLTTPLADQQTVVLPLGADRAMATQAITSLYRSSTTRSRIAIADTASVPGLALPSVSVVSSSSGSYGVPSVPYGVPSVSGYVGQPNFGAMPTLSSYSGPVASPISLSSGTPDFMSGYRPAFVVPTFNIGGDNGPPTAFSFTSGHFSGISFSGSQSFYGDSNVMTAQFASTYLGSSGSSIAIPSLSTGL